jgi:hypothetical protein
MLSMLPLQKEAVPQNGSSSNSIQTFCPVPLRYRLFQKVPGLWFAQRCLHLRHAALLASWGQPAGPAVTEAGRLHMVM